MIPAGGGAMFPSVGRRPSALPLHPSWGRDPTMTRRLRVTILAVVAAVLAACAPAYTHLNDSAHGGDNTVTNMTPATNIAAPGDPTGNMTSWSTSSSHLTRNYHGTQWVDERTGGADGVSRTALDVTGTGVQNGTQGGKIAYFDGSTLWDDWHYRNGLKIEQAQWVTDQITVTNEGDDVKFQAGSEDSRLSRSWLDGSHDDCVQSDYGMSSVLEQSLMTNCYNGLSARPSGTIDASGHEMYVDHTIVDVTDHDSCYNPTKYGCPNHAGWLKWSGDGATDLGFAASTSTFVADSYPEIGNLALNARIVTNVDGQNVTNAQACHDVTLDYRGSLTGADGAAWTADLATWQAKCPTGLIVNTGAAANTDYFNKVAAWHSTYDGGLG